MESVRIPTYNLGDPSLWFSICESAFALWIPKPITDSKTKFNYIVSHLPPEAANLARDVIIEPDETDPYNELKETLIKRTHNTTVTELQELFSNEELGERTPTELLHSMKRSVEFMYVPEDLMIRLFMQRLPEQVREILSLFENPALDKTAELADRILEVLTPEAFHTVPISDTERILFEIQKLNERIDQLSGQRDDQLLEPSTFFHNIAGSEEEELELPIRTRQVRFQRKFGLCGYHSRFGSKARNCKSPCKLSKKRKFKQ